MIEIRIETADGEAKVSNIKITGRRALVEFEIVGLAKALTAALCDGYNALTAVDVYNSVASGLHDGCIIGLTEHIRKNCNDSNTD